MTQYDRVYYLYLVGLLDRLTSLHGQQRGWESQSRDSSDLELSSSDGFQIPVSLLMLRRRVNYPCMYSFWKLLNCLKTTKWTDSSSFIFKQINKLQNIHNYYIYNDIFIAPGPETHKKQVKSASYFDWSQRSCSQDLILLSGRWKNLFPQFLHL